MGDLGPRGARSPLDDAQTGADAASGLVRGGFRLALLEAVQEDADHFRVELSAAALASSPMVVSS